MAENNHGGFRTAAGLILASASPRRQRFLNELGLDFVVRLTDVDESHHKGEAPEDVVHRLAKLKAENVSCQFPDHYVLAADTVVAIDDNVLGKPDDQHDAVSMLKQLAGRWHEVWTGFCIQNLNASVLVHRAVKTRVLFRPLTEELCLAYALTGEPLDKAGAYGLQGRGGFLVERIEGSYSNVIGLPLSEVIEELLQYNIIVPVLR